MARLPDNLREIADNVLGGFDRAVRKYERFAGLSFDNAPEYLATVAIAERLIAVAAAITLEQNIGDVWRWAGKRRFRMPENLPDYGRFDIAFWVETRGEADVRGIIEVKKAKNIRFAHVEKDVERVSDALVRIPTLKWGMVAYHGHVWDGKRRKASESLKDKTQYIEDRATAYAESVALDCARIIGRRMPLRDAENGLCGADVLVFTRS